MATGNFFKGTTHDQDARFTNKEKKLINQMNWPDEFKTKINIKKVELAAIKPWIQRRITQLMGFEDEIVVDLCISLLQDQGIDYKLCPKNIQLQLTEQKAGVFMVELWRLLIEAQNSENGIPGIVIEEKKQEKIRLEKRLKETEQKLELMRAKREEKIEPKPECSPSPSPPRYESNRRSEREQENRRSDRREERYERKYRDYRRGEEEVRSRDERRYESSRGYNRRDREDERNEYRSRYDRRDKRPPRIDRFNSNENTSPRHHYKKKYKEDRDDRYPLKQSKQIKEEKSERREKEDPIQPRVVLKTEEKPRGKLRGWDDEQAEQRKRKRSRSSSSDIEINKALEEELRAKALELLRKKNEN